MSVRYELAEIIRAFDGPTTMGALDVADAILAAGYAKPRTITSVEELDDLPVQSVIRGKWNPRDRVAVALESLALAFTLTAYPQAVITANAVLTKAITDWAEGMRDGA